MKILIRFFSGAWLAITLAITASYAASPADPPHILFIAIDDLKPLLGCYGEETVHSPRIDQLAAEGTVFLNSQCQQPTCGPSRANLLTGLRPDSTGIHDLKTKMRDINPDVLTIPQHFKNQGYLSIGMGKIFDGRCVDSRKDMDAPSWSQPFIHVYPKAENAAGFVNPQTVDWIRSQKDDQGNPIHEWNVQRIPVAEGSEDVPDNHYKDGATADRAVEWIAKMAQSEQPVFLAVGFDKPHLPFNAPGKYWDLYDRESLPLAAFREAPEGTPEWTLQPGWELRGKYDVPRKGPFPEDLQRELVHGYYACVSYIDAQVGKLLDALEVNGLKDDTIVVLWGDHGWHLGDHSMWCKHSVYEQAARAPLIFRVPDQKAPGAKTASPAEFTDIFPTLCQLAGVPVPDVLEGVSLATVLDDPDRRPRQVAMSQFPRSHPQGANLMGYTFRDERYRYTEWRKRKDAKSKGDGPVMARELYDYQTDPLETRNLINSSDHQAVLERMELAASSELSRYGIPAR